MKDMNKAMKKLQESKRAKSAKLAKLIKESIVKEDDKTLPVEVPEAEAPVEEPVETPVEEVETKYNYTVVLDNGKEITVSCDKATVEEAQEYFTNKRYVNTKTGEQANVVEVREVAEPATEAPVEESKELNEEFGSKAAELNDNDPAQKKAYDSDAEKGLEQAATKDAKIVAEEKVNEEFGSEAKELNDNDPALNKPFESETKDAMADVTKGNAINDKVDESKKISESKEVKTEDVDKDVKEATEEAVEENKLEKAKELIEVIFGMDSLEETVEAAKRELSEMIQPKEVVEIGEVENPAEEPIAESVEKCPKCGKEECICEKKVTEDIDEEPIEGAEEAETEEPANKEGEAQEIEVVDGATFEDIDDETFTEAFTKFVKENYKNAKEFKLESVTKTKEGYKFECKLTFNSGKESKVVMEAKGNIKEGKSFLRFYENKTFKHINEERSIITATVKVENKVLSCEKLRYNFTTALKENKTAKVCGLIK